MEGRGGHGAQAFGPAHPGFWLRADEGHEQDSPFALLMYVEYISRTGYRNHHSLLLVGSSYRHSGNKTRREANSLARNVRGNYHRSSWSGSTENFLG